MAYIPTIHTFEDDVNESRGIETPQAELGTEAIVSRDNILIPEKPKSSFLKFFLTFISILFFLGAAGAVGYYYYTDYQNKQAEASLNSQSAAKAQEQQTREQASIVNNLKTIFPNIADDMAQYINGAVKKGNIIIVTIKPNEGGVNNYSQLYAYMLAHQKDLGKDLVNTFNLNEIADSISKSNALIATTSSSTIATTTEQIATSSKSATKKKVTTKTTATSSTLETVVNLFDPTSLQNNFSTLVTNMTTPTTISGEELIWESKTLNNQDFQIANAGVVTLIYGYVKQDYLVFSVSLKDFFDTIKGLQ